jgi:hypothetical protein
MTSDKPVFVFRTLVSDIGKFTELSEQAARLKKFGRVEMTISALATKARYEFPEGGSAWHEYASHNPSLHKFFPHEKIAPFIPSDFVAANRHALDERLEVIRRLDLGACFWAGEPAFLPEGFFEAYPHLRGPRVDHPRRSRREEFAPCIDHEENLEMWASMMAQLARHVPELGTFSFKTNDAGSGICWADWLYSGVNGPVHCRGRTTGQRVAGLMQALRDGASQGGGGVKIFMTPQFLPHEMQEIRQLLPEGCYMEGRRRGSDEVVSISCSTLNDCNPVKGIFSPLPIITASSRIKRDTKQIVFLNARVFYNRDVELTDVWEHVLAVIERCIEQPVSGLMATLERLREHCVQWAGADRAEELMGALAELDEALRFGKTALAPLSTIYLGVSLRHITRPLVAAPSYLSEQDEAGWLEHVFNIWVDEAREDYLDLHGGRPRPVTIDALGPYLARLAAIADKLDEIARGSGADVIAKTSLALRIYASVLRSCGNFHNMQTLRDRNKEKFAEVAPRPPKTGDWTGDPDLMRTNALMRDELDNAHELIDLLTGGGMELVCHAQDPSDEDTFLLGPDLIEQIKAKSRTMRRHWLNAEKHLTSPLK